MLQPRTFGLEFEHVSKLSHPQLATRLQQAGVRVDPNGIGRGHQEYQGWQVKSDGSITTQGEFRTGTELTTPPMTLKEYPELRTALKVAKLHGGVNASCGLHCHVHAPELSGVIARRPIEVWTKHVAEVWQRIEPVLFAHMPPSRRSSQYCRPGVQWATKYMACNFSPLHDRETIEFRLHNSTLNPVKAIAWAALCLAIVEHMIQLKAETPEFKPDARQAVEPRLIRTSNGGQFFLQRDIKGKWLIEAGKVLTTEVDELADAHKEFKRQLKLVGKSHLAAFNFPAHGNAMTALCDVVGVRGMFRSYLGERYDHMLKKHGTADTRPVERRVEADEADFYHEQLFTPEVELPGIRDEFDGAGRDDEDHERDDDDISDAERNDRDEREERDGGSDRDRRSAYQREQDERDE